jgi:SAM-dependent methyltransferase
MVLANIKEAVKNFWDKQPCNIKHSPAPIGTRQYFDEVEARKYFVESHIPGFAQFEHWKGKSVFEIGCGIGTDSINFARADAKLTVVELSPVSLELTRKRFGVYGLKAEFYLADAEHLSKIVPVKNYDLIYSFGVLHHTPNPQAAIKEILKYMGPDSELRLMLYAKYSWKNLMINLRFTQPEAQSGCPIVYTFSRRQIRELLKDLKILSIRKDHIFPYDIERYKNYEYVKTLPWRYLPKFLFRWLERALGWHTLIVAKR